MEKSLDFNLSNKNYYRALLIAVICTCIGLILGFQGFGIGLILVLSGMVGISLIRMYRLWFSQNLNSQETDGEAGGSESSNKTTGSNILLRSLLTIGELSIYGGFSNGILVANQDNFGDHLTILGIFIMGIYFLSYIIKLNILTIPHRIITGLGVLSICIGVIFKAYAFPYADILLLFGLISCLVSGVMTAMKISTFGIGKYAVLAFFALYPVSNFFKVMHYPYADDIVLLSACVAILGFSMVLYAQNDIKKKFTLGVAAAIWFLGVAFERMEFGTWYLGLILQVVAFLIYLTTLIREEHEEGSSFTTRFKTGLIVQFVIFITVYPPLLTINKHASFIVFKVKNENEQVRNMDYSEWREGIERKNRTKE